jgi:hypothetical protein
MGANNGSEKLFKKTNALSLVFKKRFFVQTA